MERTIICKGKFIVAYARDASGEELALTFYESLDLKDRAKITTHYQYLCEGNTSNPEKFGDLGNGLYEIKSHQIRMPYAFSKNPSERSVILITHGFFKKKRKAPKQEIERALRILREDAKWGEKARKFLS